MINWYNIGNINDIKNSEIPRFGAGVIVLGVEPEIFISNTVSEDGESLQAIGFIKYKEDSLSLQGLPEVYISKSGNSAIRVSGNTVQIGVRIE